MIKTRRYTTLWNTYVSMLRSLVSWWKVDILNTKGHYAKCDVANSAVYYVFLTYTVDQIQAMTCDSSLLWMTSHVYNHIINK